MSGLSCGAFEFSVSRNQQPYAPLTFYSSPQSATPGNGVSRTNTASYNRTSARHSFGVEHWSLKFTPPNISFRSRVDKILTKADEILSSVENGLTRSTSQHFSSLLKSSSLNDRKKSPKALQSNATTPGSLRETARVLFRSEVSVGTPTRLPSSTQLPLWRIDDFDVDHKIGTGRFGKIYRARESKTRCVVAIKCISKDLIAKNGLEAQLQLEMLIHASVHKNFIIQRNGYLCPAEAVRAVSVGLSYVLRLLAYFWDEKIVYLVEDLADAGDLEAFRLSHPGERLPESEARVVVAMTALALYALHARGIAHRDIKTNNILLHRHRQYSLDNSDMERRSGPSPKGLHSQFPFEVRLADFTWAVQLSGASERRSTLCGTLDYLAPEMIRQSGHGVEVDMWGLGVVAYELLYGISPFAENTPADTCVRILNGLLVFPPENDNGLYPHVSPEAKDFIRALLVDKCSERLSAELALAHPWLSQVAAKLVPEVNWGALSPLLGVLEQRRQKSDVNISYMQELEKHSSSSVLKPRHLLPSVDTSSDKEAALAPNAHCDIVPMVEGNSDFLLPDVSAIALGLEGSRFSNSLHKSYDEHVSNTSDVCDGQCSGRNAPAEVFDEKLSNEEQHLVQAGTSYQILHKELKIDQCLAPVSESHAAQSGILAEQKDVKIPSNSLQQDFAVVAASMTSADVNSDKTVQENEWEYKVNSNARDTPPKQSNGSAVSEVSSWASTSSASSRYESDSAENMSAF